MNVLMGIIKNMPNNKAVGTDGFNVEFSKAAWPKCGKNVLQRYSTDLQNVPLEYFLCFLNFLRNFPIKC